MARTVDFVPKYCRHKASGQAVVTIAGHDHYLGPWKSKASHIEYDRLVGEWLAQGRPAFMPASPSDLSVVELCAAYWRFAKGYYVKNDAPTSEQAGSQTALRILRRYYGHTAAAAFGPLALKALRGRFIEAGHGRLYVNQNVGRIKRVFRWAAAEELLPVAVYQALATVPGLAQGKTTAPDRAPVAPVRDDDVNATLPFLPTVVADIVRLQRLTGCRPTEVCILRPCDVDTSSDVWCYTPASHKTEHRGRTRRIYIGPKGQDVLRPYLLRDNGTFCFVPAESERTRNAKRRENRRTTMTPSQASRRPQRHRERPAGIRYTKDSYRRAVARAVERANASFQQRVGEDDRPRVIIPHWHPNQLRHSVATNIRRRYGLEAAQVTLGHSKADITQTYAERDFSLAERVMGEVG
jgi:integrase